MGDGAGGESVGNAGGGPDRSEPMPRLCFIVDDEPAICRLVTFVLTNFGIATEQFDSAHQMLDGMARNVPDIIFLDISLGDSDAIDAIRGLAAREYRGTVQLISGSYTLLNEVQRIGERHGLHMLPALSKPFAIAALRQVVETYSSRAGAGDRLAAPRVAPRGPRVTLVEAMANDWLEFWYQPKFDLRGRKMVGAEALARVRHPEHGIIMPGEFLPAAADDAMIALSERALRTVLSDFHELHAAGLAQKLSLNVPASALIALPILNIVRDSRQAHGAPASIILEITEDQIFHDITKAHEIATQLRIYGVEMAIDDFGQAYSSLARLKELSFSEIKLDHTFVQGCSVNPTNAMLCQTVIELAHRLGSTVVAEGVETVADLIAIAQAGCDLVQGFLFSPAMPKQHLLGWRSTEGELTDAVAVLEQIWGDTRGVRPKCL